jgi:hypothetical protein
MEGCGPCNATRPEWNRLYKYLHNKYYNRNDIAIADVEHNHLSKILNQSNFFQ